MVHFSHGKYGQDWTWELLFPRANPEHIIEHSYYKELIYPYRCSSHKTEFSVKAQMVRLSKAHAEEIYKV